LENQEGRYQHFYAERDVKMIDDNLQNQTQNPFRIEEAQHSASRTIA